MTKIIGALEKWADSFEEIFVYESPTGPILPKVTIGAIEGGAPYRPNHFPGVCCIYVDVRTPPVLRPVAVQAEIQRVLSSVGVDYDLEAYRSQMGYEGRGVESLVSAVEEAYEFLFHEKIKPEVPERASIWTDTNIYNEMGIPAVKIGPRGRHRTLSPRGEEIDIADIVKAAQIYALVALDICNRERTEITITPA
jgi:acetylornithine deacetylase/succinyl-diaminopimelate desuccinylase-like protein